jgi:ABC-type molybdate transport system permease subunit
MLDAIQDPHNLGALIRSAACAGAQGVIIPKDRACGVTPVVEKASAGAVETLPVIQVTNLVQALERLKQAGCWAYGLAGEAGTDIYQTDLRGNLVLVIGSEGEGLRPLVRKQCDGLLAIPQYGGVSSLNASVAGGGTIFTAGIVLAVMILPIITAITREVFLQTPRLYEEAALALGATRWEMIRTVVLPFGRPGLISGAMLGLGRALGETLAVAMVLSASGVITFNLISSVNPSTIAANVALKFPEAYGINVNVLIATGLILFAITLVVNSIARVIVNRRKEFSAAN